MHYLILKKESMTAILYAEHQIANQNRVLQ